MDVEVNWRSECHVPAAWCTPVSARHPYGQLRHGELHISGKLKEVTCPWMRFYWMGLNFKVAGDGSGVACSFDFASPEEPTEVDAVNVFLLLLGTSCYYDNRHWPAKNFLDSVLSRTEERDEHITNFLREKSEEAKQRGLRVDEGEKYAPEYCNVWGLALTSVAGTDKFVRIGIFRISWEFGGLRYFDDVPVSTVKII